MKVSDHTLRGNAMGIFEANVMLWQIMARQGEIPAKRSRRILAGNDQAVFAHFSSSTQVFDAGRISLGHVLRAATGETQALAG